MIYNECVLYLLRCNPVYESDNIFTCLMIDIVLLTFATLNQYFIYEDSLT